MKAMAFERIPVLNGYGLPDVGSYIAAGDLCEIREKAALVDKLYSGEITIDEVPTDWQEEIRRRVNERITADGEAAEQPVSGDEFLSMMEEVL